MTIITGDQTKGLQFDGVNHYCQNNPSTPFQQWDKEQPFTFSTTIYIYALATPLTAIFDTRTGSGLQGISILIKESKFCIQLVNANGSNQLYVHASMPLQDNALYQLQITYDGSSQEGGLQFYINGVLSNKEVASNNLTDSIKTSGQETYRIGYKLPEISSLEYFPGKMQNLSFVDYVKSAEELQADYQRGYQAKGTGAYLLNLDFNQRIGTQFTSSDSNQYLIDCYGYTDHADWVYFPQKFAQRPVVAAQFNGTNTYWENDPATPFQKWKGNVPWTMFIQFKLTATSANIQMLFSNRLEDGGLTGINCHILPTMKLGFTMAESGNTRPGTFSVQSNLTITTNVEYTFQLHYTAINQDLTDFTIYLLEPGKDVQTGVFQPYQDFATQVPVNTDAQGTTLRVGTHHRTLWFNGLISQVSFVNYAKSEAEIIEDNRLGYQRKGSGEYLVNIDFRDKTTPIISKDPNAYQLNPQGYTGTPFTKFSEKAVRSFQRNFSLKKYVAIFNGTSNYWENETSTPFQQWDREQAFTVFINGSVGTLENTTLSIFDSRTSNQYKGVAVFIENRKLTLQLIADVGNSLLYVRSSQELHENQEYQFHITYDGNSQEGGVQFYINGVLAPRETVHNTLSDTIQTTGQDIFRVGYKIIAASSLNYFQGNIQNLSFVNYAKSEAEIQEDCQRGYQIQGSGEYLLNIHFQDKHLPVISKDAYQYQLSPQGYTGSPFQEIKSVQNISSIAAAQFNGINNYWENDANTPFQKWKGDIPWTMFIQFKLRDTVTGPENQVFFSSKLQPSGVQWLRFFVVTPDMTFRISITEGENTHPATFSGITNNVSAKNNTDYILQLQYTAINQDLSDFTLYLYESDGTVQKGGFELPQAIFSNQVFIGEDTQEFVSFTVGQSTGTVTRWFEGLMSQISFVNYAKPEAEIIQDYYLGYQSKGSGDYLANIDFRENTVPVISKDSHQYQFNPVGYATSPFGEVRSFQEEFSTFTARFNGTTNYWENEASTPFQKWKGNIPWTMFIQFNLVTSSTEPQGFFSGRTEDAGGIGINVQITPAMNVLIVIGDSNQLNDTFVVESELQIEPKVDYTLQVRYTAINQDITDFTLYLSQPGEMLKTSSFQPYQSFSTQVPTDTDTQGTTLRIGKHYDPQFPDWFHGTISQISFIDYAKSEVEVVKDAYLGYQGKGEGEYLLNIDFRENTIPIVSKDPYQYKFYPQGYSNAPFQEILPPQPSPKILARKKFAASLNGTSGYLTNDNNTPFTQWEHTQAWTFFCKFRLNVYPGDHASFFQTIVAQSVGGRYLQIAIRNTGVIGWGLVSGGSGFTIASPEIVPLHQLNTLQITYTGVANSTESVQMKLNNKTLAFTTPLNNLNDTILNDKDRFEVGVSRHSDGTGDIGYLAGQIHNLSFVDYVKTEQALYKDSYRGYQSKGSGEYLLNVDLNTPNFDTLHSRDSHQYLLALTNIQKIIV